MEELAGVSPMEVAELALEVHLKRVSGSRALDWGIGLIRPTDSDL